MTFGLGRPRQSSPLTLLHVATHSLDGSSELALTAGHGGFGWHPSVIGMVQFRLWLQVQASHCCSECLWCRRPGVDFFCIKSAALRCRFFVLYR